MFADRVGALDDSDPAPLYRRLQRVLREAIHKSVLSPEEALPAERDLAAEFGVSRVTVRKAIDGLVSEGLLSRRQGAGTWVAARVEKSFSKLSSFTEDMRARGRVPHSVWISKTAGEVTPAESLTLGLSPGTAVYRFSRIRYADGTPMALEFTAVPASCLPSTDVVDESLYEALERYGARPKRALQRLRAILFEPEHAERLGVAPHSAGLLIERHGFLKDGRVVEATQSYYRGDAYDFVAELSET